MKAPWHALAPISIGEGPRREPGPLTDQAIQPAGVSLFGRPGDRLRAAALERRLVEVAPALRVEVDLALAALVAGALRVAPALRGAAGFGLAFDEAPDPLVASSSVHLPDSTRCAASATASAISVPSLEAEVIMLFAAWLALSAASIPASRIARRAFGLAAIAAAAAVNPAAIISRLIAAFASLSKLPLFDDPLLPLSFFDDLAILASLLVSGANPKDGSGPKQFRIAVFEPVR